MLSGLHGTDIVLGKGGKSSLADLLGNAGPDDRLHKADVSTELMGIDVIILGRALLGTGGLDKAACFACVGC